MPEANVQTTERKRIRHTMQLFGYNVGDNPNWKDTGRRKLSFIERFPYQYDGYKCYEFDISKEYYEMLKKTCNFKLYKGAYYTVYTKWSDERKCIYITGLYNDQQTTAAAMPNKKVKSPTEVGKDELPI